MSYAAIFDTAPVVTASQPLSSIQVDGVFQNSEPEIAVGAAWRTRALWRFFTGKDANSTPPQPLKAEALTPNDLQKAPDISETSHGVAWWRQDSKLATAHAQTHMTAE